MLPRTSLRRALLSRVRSGCCAQNFAYNNIFVRWRTKPVLENELSSEIEEFALLLIASQRKKYGDLRNVWGSPEKGTVKLYEFFLAGPYGPLQPLATLEYEAASTCEHRSVNAPTYVFTKGGSSFREDSELLVPCNLKASCGEL